MQRSIKFAAMLLACAAVAACHGKPSGTQGGDASPVATLNDRTITVADVKAELGGAAPPTNPQAAASVNRAALQSIISRELMARAADAEKIDKAPGVDQQMKAAADGVKAAALAKQIMAKAPQPTDAEIQKFIAANPRAFADRKFLVVDQLELMGPMPALPSDEPKTMEAWQAFLGKAGVPYQRRIDLVDSGAADPKVFQNLTSIAPGATFRVNNGRGVTVNQIIETRAAPLSGPGAVSVAKSYLANQAAETAAKEYLDNLRKDPKVKIRYEPGYEPEAPEAAK